MVSADEVKEANRTVGGASEEGEEPESQVKMTSQTLHGRVLYLMIAGC